MGVCVHESAAAETCNCSGIQQHLLLHGGLDLVLRRLGNVIGLALAATTGEIVDAVEASIPP